MANFIAPLRTRVSFYRQFWQVLTTRRRNQVVVLQILGILAALGEVANLGALLAFLRMLANPAQGLASLGPIGTLAAMLPAPLLLPSLGLGFMLIVAITNALRAITQVGQLRLIALIGSDLGGLVYYSALRRPYQWHLNHNTSTVLNILTKDVEQVVSSFQSLISFFLNAVIVLFLGMALISISPGLMIAIGVLIGLFYALVYRFTRASFHADGEMITRSHERMIRAVQEGLGGIRDVLIDGSQGYFENAFSTSYRLQRLAIASINAKAQVPRFLIEGFTMILIVGVALAMALRGEGVEKQLPLLGTLALGAYRLLLPLQLCFASVASLTANTASVLRLKPYLVPGGGMAKAAPAQLRSLQSLSFRVLHLNQVVFAYNSDSPPILNGIHITIQRGELIGLVGSTGSGKTTLVDLILGLLQPDDGEILLDGRSLHSTAGLLRAWQASIAHVPQQIYLSDACLAENIAFGSPLSSINWQRLRVAARQARLDQFIEAQPKGYHTVVGERGVRLSGGQRQRIGIARALYKNAQLLILDEATSALDNVTESEVVEAIEALENHMTVIMIAHRLSTVQRCDRIILLENGRVSAEGSYAHLLSDSQSFRQLVDSAGRNSLTSLPMAE